MNFLNTEQLNMVHGGADLYITQLVPTDGISQQCIQKIVTVMQPDFYANVSEEFLAFQVLSACTFDEIDLIEQRSSTVLPTKVEFK